MTAVKTPAEDFPVLAKRYLADAKTLQAQNGFDSALYLAGYALECALKFRICKTLGWTEFPPTGKHSTLKNHDPNFLLSFTGSGIDLERSHSADWQKVKDWDPEIRYVAKSAVSETECADALTATDNLLKELL